MKNLAKKMMIGATAFLCALSFAACASGEANKPGTDDKTQPAQSMAERQIARAKQTYESFYKKEGGLFTAQPSAQTAAKASAYRAAEVLSDGVADGNNVSGGADFAAMHAIFEKYPVAYANNIKLTFNSYVADIFSYSQVQSSIIEQFGEDSLTDVYALAYEKVDWNSDTTGYADWINSTKLLSAAFAGTDLENGNVYCTQAHVSNTVLVLANVEYTYRSDGDMGVTTVNFHGNGNFEYHYCSAGTYEILQAFGTYDENGDIALSSFAAINRQGIRDSRSFEQGDRQAVYDYVLAEVARIDGKIEDLQKQNGRDTELDGTEKGEGNGEEHVGVCSVNFDFSKLANMLVG